jgi:hypothetical protein
MRKICFAILLVPALAWAQSRSAADWYKEGENQYNLGNFDKAVDAFKQGFSLETNDSKKPAYLYNVAQSYRQANDCKNALFFYKRFLALKNGDTTKPLSAKVRKDVEGWIAEADACVQQAASFGKKQPTNNLPPGGEGGENASPDGDGSGHKDTDKAVAVDGDDDDEGGSITKPAQLAGPHVISARLTGGGSKVSIGSIERSVQATFALVAGYPIAVNDQLTIDVGGAFTFTPLPYDIVDPPGSAMTRSETAQLIGLMANAGATYEVIPKLGLRGDLGLGALFFANVSESPFTGGASASGALTMFHLRAALSADYAFTPNVIGTLTPIAFSYSPPKAGLIEDITAITSIDFMVGIGYRM